MNSLTVAGHAAMGGCDNEGADNARTRWNELHTARHRLAPFADAYRAYDSGMRYAQKSKILEALNIDIVRNIEKDGRKESGTRRKVFTVIAISSCTHMRL